MTRKGSGVRIPYGPPFETAGHGHFPGSRGAGPREAQAAGRPAGLDKPTSGCAGAATAVVLGGERASEVRLELPALHELGSTDAIVEVAASNGPRLNCLLSLKPPDLRTGLQSVERAVATFTEHGR